MAKTKSRPESVSGYFRKLFETESELLDHGKNDVILARWKADHPGEPVTDKVKNNMSNTKSVVRKKLGKIKRRRRHHANDGVASAPKVHKVRTTIATLEKLEGLIDQCLSVARAHETPGLALSIKNLLAARSPWRGKWASRVESFHEPDA